MVFLLYYRSWVKERPNHEAFMELTAHGCPENADMIQSWVRETCWKRRSSASRQDSRQAGMPQAFSFPYFRPVILRCNLISLIVCLRLWIEQAPEPTVAVSFSKLSMGLHNWGILKVRSWHFRRRWVLWKANSRKKRQPSGSHVRYSVASGLGKIQRRWQWDVKRAKLNHI